LTIQITSHALVECRTPATKDVRGIISKQRFAKPVGGQELYRE